jgi:hypothetical protein
MVRRPVVWCRGCFDLGGLYRTGYCSTRCQEDARDVHAETCGCITEEMLIRRRVDAALTMRSVKKKIQTIIWESFHVWGENFYVVMDASNMIGVVKTYDHPIVMSVDLMVRHPSIRTNGETASVMNACFLFFQRKGNKVHLCPMVMTLNVGSL